MARTARHGSWRRGTKWRARSGAPCRSSAKASSARCCKRRSQGPAQRAPGLGAPLARQHGAASAGGRCRFEADRCPGGVSPAEPFPAPGGGCPGEAAGRNRPPRSSQGLLRDRCGRERGCVLCGVQGEVLKDHLERPELEASKVADIFRSVDLDGKGVIDYTEFVAACLDHKVEEEEGVCWAAFQVFDKDCNGVVTFEELEQVLNSASMEGTFSPELRKELWSQLTAGAEDVDFDHFLAALRGVRPPVPTETAKALPLPRRQHGAVGAMGLPIKARGVNEAAPTGLPIKARGANESPPTGLPIKARGVNEAAPAGLPIKARGVNEATPAGLPIKARGVNEAAPAGLPIKARGVNEAAPAGLPIKARGVNEAPLLPIGKK
ncbi:unnamed protein product [Effrenium voratum]|uniref:EF-hand domain-containing protein n=1 Tax=Effrenium voratum TaxID=2562239 RepID=A0AA36N327_9DINO|nr:unnamed protein product [Effrenium voratum]